MEALTKIQTSTKSNFDAENPPERELIEDCVHCGFCLPACPTYVLWGKEMDSPRGRIYMMKSASAGQTPLNTTFQTHMDNCLGCMACMTACPSGVQYGKLIEDTRAQMERNIPRTWADRLYRRMLFATFPYPARLRLLALPMWLYQKLGIQKLVRASGLLERLPRRLRAMEALLPAVPKNVFRKLPAIVSPATAPRMRVGMLAGCVQQVFFQHVNEATVRVLAAEGCEVVIPPQQSCCGALMLHSGLNHEAMATAKKLITAFEEANVDHIVINAAGCGSAMKEYGHLFRHDKDWSARANAFSAKCKDIAEILTSLPAQAPRHPLRLRVAYHDACHLRHAQSVFNEPRALLASVPNVDVIEVEEANICCGSAGVYNLLYPDSANELAGRKVDRLLATKAEALVSANPGCLIQLTSALRRRGLATMPAFHMVELLDASIRGMSPQELIELHCHR